MRRGILFILITGLFFGLVAGCGPQKEGSAQEAIDAAKAMETVKEKTDYLIAQAKAFYNSKDFQGAIDIAQYILSYLDKDSSSAQDLIEKAKNALMEQAQSAADSLKGGVESFGQ
jgi:hypothetical protein